MNTMSTYAFVEPTPVQLNKSVKRGEVYEFDLQGVMGSEQGGIRPCLIVSNDVGNFYSPILKVVPLTSSEIKTPLPTHVDLDAATYRLRDDSIALCEQMRSVSKLRLTTGKRISRLDIKKMEEIEYALKFSLGFIN